MPTQAEELPRTRAARIEAALREALDPTSLAVEDESAQHAGHSGASSGGQTHYRVAATSRLFQGLSRLERSRLVHSLLTDEFDSGLHALSLTLSVPG